MKTKTKIEALAGYKFKQEIEVAWGDMDAMSHVNNTRYLNYMETARIAFFTQFFKEFSGIGSTTSARGLALAEVRCRFKVPLTYPDKVIVGCAVGQIDVDQFMIIHQIYSSKLGFVAAEGDARMVSYDYVNTCRSVINDPLRAQLEAFKL